MVQLQVKRGSKVNLPALADGEFAFTTDTNELFIGTQTEGNLNLGVANGGSGIDTTPPPDATPSPTINITSTSLTLRWNSVSAPDLAGYNVYNGLTKLNNSLVTATTYDVTGLTAGVGYTFKITSVDVTGNESAGTIVSAVTSPPADTTPPANIVFNATTNITSTSLTLNWNAVSDADLAGYNVYNGLTKLNNSLITTTSYGVTGLLAGSAYTFKVTSVDAVGNESSGTTKTETTATAGVQKLYLSGINTWLNTPSLTWDRAVIDFMPLSLPTTDSPGIVVQDNTLGGPNVYYVQGGNDTFGSNVTVYDGNGVQQTSGVDFIKDGVRMTLDVRPTTAQTHGIIFFNGASSYNREMEGYIYDVKVYNAGTLVLHYDMTTGTAVDQTGNKHDGTIMNGVWMVDSASVTDSYAPYEVTSPAIANLTGTSFTVSWTRSKSKDIAKYNVYQNGTLIGTVNHPTVAYSVTGLTASTSYNYKITSVDTTNNESPGFPFMIETTGVARTDAIPPVTNGMMLNLDLTNRAGSIANTLNDTVSGIVATAPNSFGNQNGVYPSINLYNNVSYGWIDNNGIKLIGNSVENTSSAVHVTSKTSPLGSMDVSQGITIETGYLFSSASATQIMHNITGGIETHITTGGQYALNVYYISSGKETDSLNITHAATADGNITITLNGVATAVPVANGDTMNAIGDKIRAAAASFSGWQVGGTPGTSTVTFASNNSGTNAAPAFSGGTTGTAGTISVSVAGGTAGAQKQTTIQTGSAGTGGAVMTSMIDGITQKTYGAVIAPVASLNHFVTRLQPDGTVSLMLNEYISTQKILDFQSWVNWFSVNDLYLGGWQNGSVNFARIYNRPLTDDEIKQNYTFQNSNIPLSSIVVSPMTVTLNPGETQGLVVQTNPIFYNDKVTLSFESGNSGFVTVDSNGILTGATAGQTNIKVTATYGATTLTQYVNVTVGSAQAIAPPPTRTLQGLTLSRYKTSIGVGENYVCMAYTLPYDIMYDNVLTWTTSDPSVCTVNYGILEGKAVGTATITVKDISQTVSNTFTVNVTPATVVAITNAQTYQVTPTDYGISTDNTNSTATTNGIISALNYASTNGYKKIVFPYGTYLVTPTVSGNPTAGVIKLPSNMTIDFSDSIINIEFSSLTAKGYTMFLMTDVQYCQLIHTHVFGEADYTTVQTSVENCISLIIRNAYKSGIDSSSFSKSPGFNVSTGTDQVATGTTYSMLSYTDFVAGNITDAGANDDSNTTFCFRNNNYYDISGLGSYYFVGMTLGYWGYPYMRSRLYSIYFYDSSKNFVVAQKYNRQFFNYDKPAGVKYARIVVYQDAAPTSGSSDFNNAALFIKTVGMPRDCFITNSKFQNNYSCGLAMCGGQNWLLKGNYFSGNNNRMPACDIDWEDGWDCMVGDVVRENEFHSNLGITTADGQSLSFFNNKFFNSYMHIWNRTQSWRAFNNTFDGKGGGASGTSNVQLGTQEDSYFSRNILIDGINYSFSDGSYHPSALYTLHMDQNTVS